MLVTGATGFVGSVLCDTLVRSGYLVRAAGRGGRTTTGGTEYVVIGDMGGDLRCQEALVGVDSVVHLAARTHIPRNSPANSNLYMAENALGTSNLAQQAAEAGVRRFIFLSSVKVNGEATTTRAFTSHDEPQPQDAYGASKLAGEKLAMRVGRRMGMGVMIVRSPLIYGPGVKAHFLSLMRWIDEEKVLPLGAVENKRSLVSIWNLCDLILRLLTGPIAPVGVWMVSDGQDFSTPELIRELASVLDRRANLLQLPVQVLHFLGDAFGYRAQVARLCSSLTVDIVNTRDVLNWSPPLSVAEGLRRTARWYRSTDALREC